MANKKTKVAIAVGAGILAAGAAAGYYFFTGADAKKNKKIVTKWASKFKKDVEKEIKSLKSTEQSAVTSAVEKVAATYKGIEGVTVKELASAVSELKNNWKKLIKIK